MGFVPYGVIVRTHGIKGDICVVAFSRDFSNLEHINNIYLKAGHKNTFRKFRINSYFLNGRHAVLNLVGLDDFESANQLKNSTVYVDSSELSDTAQDEYYWFQLMGMSVYSTRGEFIGKVCNLLDREQQSLLIVKNTENNEIMVPFVDEIVKHIELEKCKIIIDPPGGLLELNKSGTNK